MDRRSFLGITLITLAVCIVLLWSNNSQKKNATAKAKYEQQLEESRQSAEQATWETPISTTIASQDSLSPLFSAKNGTESISILDNGLIKIGISSKGAVPCSATLSNYNDQQGNNVTLFSKEEIGLNFMIDGKNENIRTRDLYFTPISQTNESVVMRLNVQGYGYLDFTYNLKPNSYILDLDMQAVGLDNFFSTELNSLSMDWIQNLRQHEKGFEFEQRYTTLTYKYTDKAKSKIMGQRKSTSKVSLEDPLDWIAYKNQFFSCIIASEQNFIGGSTLSGMSYQKGKGYMKKFQSKVLTAFDPTGNEPTSLHFYLGPNDYKILKSDSKLISDNKKFRLNRVIDLGWPVVREVNRFLIMPLFNLLSKWDLNMGLVILLMTLIVKVIVFPAQLKSFMSSAKMRALKPYVDEINAKYPKPEDAMQKQQETMALYSKYGVGLMGGCLPSLVQMPVWMAFFFFVPNAIELRQQSFLWAEDLTGFDDIIRWSNNVPLIGTHLSIFCVLFCVTNIINTIISMRQQQTTGQADQMKAMKWMMYLMPVIFFFSFNNYSSGLCYYYFISGLVSIITMIWLRKSTDEKKILAKLEADYEASRNDPNKRKQNANGMMARLEALQKEQERLQKQQKQNQK